MRHIYNMHSYAILFRCQLSLPMTNWQEPGSLAKFESWDAAKRLALSQMMRKKLPSLWNAVNG